MRQRFCVLLRPLLALAMIACCSQARATQPDFDMGLLRGAEVSLPDGPAVAALFLFSTLDGLGLEEREIAERARQAGAAVIAADLPLLLAEFEEADTDCIYLVSDIESISQQVGRATGSAELVPSVMAGRGAGGALVLDTLVQTPPATIDRAIAVDPDTGIPLRKALCTEARREQSSGLTHYVLPPGKQPAALTIVRSSLSGADTDTLVAALDKSGVEFRNARTEEPPGPALLNSVLEAVDAIGVRAQDLPLSELPAKATRDTMAIVLSGDGGWRDLDRSIAEALQEKGVPTIGIDSLRYFWSPRTPQQTAGDLAAVIERYSTEWNTRNVLLIGYSFGADVIPASFAALPAEVRNRIRQVSLLGLASRADWEITVTGWLGSASSEATPTEPEIASIDPSKLQCFYGEEEDDTLCPKLAARGVEVIKTTGGHHFDGDYDALARRILSGLDRRLRQSDAKR